MAHRRSFRGRSAGISDSQRRKKTWLAAKIGFPVTAGRAVFGTALRMFTSATGAVAGDIENSLLASIAPGDVGEGDEVSTFPDECTILRTRGSLLFPKWDITGSATVPGAIVGQYAFGIGVTDIRTLSQGISPGPIVDADWDGWMFLRQSAISPVDSEGTIVDIKSMRKIKSGDALFIAAQAVAGDNVSVSAGAWEFDLRFLVLLP